jgi:hypothetical protein
MGLLARQSHHHPHDYTTGGRCCLLLSWWANCEESWRFHTSHNWVILKDGWHTGWANKWPHIIFALKICRVTNWSEIALLCLEDASSISRNFLELQGHILNSEDARTHSQLRGCIIKFWTCILEVWGHVLNVPGCILIFLDISRTCPPYRPRMLKLLQA